jgi:hypothetical protein
MGMDIVLQEELRTMGSQLLKKAFLVHICQNMVRHGIRLGSESASRNVTRTGKRKEKVFRRRQGFFGWHCSVFNGRLVPL